MRNRFSGVDFRLPALVALRVIVWGIVVGGSGLGAAAQESASSGADALRSPDEKVRLQAIDALGHAGPDAESAVAKLVEQMTDKSPAVRAHAAHALEMIGPAASDAAAALVKAIGDPDVHVRRTAIMALERIHPDPRVVVAALGKALKDNKDPAVRVAALDALTNAGEAAVGVLTKALADPETRYWAALALGELGPAAQGAIDALVSSLKDERPEVRREVLIALARIGPDAARAVPAIVPLLTDADPSVRNSAAFALGRMGPAAVSATDALRQATKDPDELLRAVSAWALAHIDPKDQAVREQAIPLLTAALKNQNPRVQSMALRGLVDLHPRPAELLPLLSGIIAKGDPALVGDALGALASMGDAGAPVLIAALKRPEARGGAATLIARLATPAKAAVPGLIEALADRDADVRREVLFALATIGPDAAAAAPAIVGHLQDPEVRIRATAAYALGRIGPAAKAAIPPLRQELTSAELLSRVAGAWALAHIAPQDEQVVRDAVPVLIRGLQSPTAAVRRGAADALGRIGKPAIAAQGALETATRDPDETVRKAALLALERMGAVLDGPVPQQAVPKQRR